MSDWDSDGDEDYVDGVISGIFWMSPVWLSLAILLAALLYWWWTTW